MCGCDGVYDGLPRGGGGAGSCGSAPPGWWFSVMRDFIPDCSCAGPASLLRQRVLPCMRDRRRLRTLVDERGRKYLTAGERERFLAAVRSHRKPAVQTLARTLAMTGCRVSEALGIRARDVDLEANEVRIATLKRRTDHWRAVPVPEDLVHAFDLVHRLRSAQASPQRREPAALGPRQNGEREHLPHALARDPEMARHRALAHPVPARQTGPCDTAPRCESSRPPHHRKGLTHWQSFAPPRQDHPAATVV